MKAPRTLCCAGLLALSAAAWACGVCIEDKVAATYDHAVVQRAAAQGRVMVFCEISGAVDERRIRSAARQVRGLDRSSVRLSAEPAAVSFALDPAQQSPQAAVTAMQRAMATGTHLSIVKLVSPHR